MGYYEIGDLWKKLKDQGLDLAEDATGLVYKSVMDWAEDSAKASPTPLDDLAIPFKKQVDALVLPQIDKIDGKVG